MPVFAVSTTTAFWILALVASGLFVIKLMLTIFGGDAEVDADADVDVDGATFTFFSVQGILAFLMGLGWMTLAGFEWGWGPTWSVLAGVAFGGGMMLLSALLMLVVFKLDHEVHYDLNATVGTTGRVYLAIPAEGLGQVEITVGGRSQIFKARSKTGEPIGSFKVVTVEGVVGDSEILVVSPVG